VNDISDMISFDQPWIFILNDCYVLTKEPMKMYLWNDLSR